MKVMILLFRCFWMSMTNYRWKHWRTWQGSVTTAAESLMTKIDVFSSHCCPSSTHHRLLTMTLTCMAVLCLSACLSVCCFNYMYITITRKLLYKQGPTGPWKSWYFNFSRPGKSLRGYEKQCGYWKYLNQFLKLLECILLTICALYITVLSKCLFVNVNCLHSAAVLMSVLN